LHPARGCSKIPELLKKSLLPRAEKHPDFKVTSCHHFDSTNTNSAYIKSEQEDRALLRSNPSAWSMPEDGKEHIFYHMLLSSPSSFGSKAKNLLNWCKAPTKAKQAQSSAPVGHMSGLSIRRDINVSIL